MMEHSGKTESVWMEPGLLPVPTLLNQDLETEVCVIGGGLAGLSVAYELSRRGQQVVVLEDGLLASGETERTTAHLTNAFDDRFFRVENLHGEKCSRLVAESHSAAIDYIESTMLRERIDCDFERLDGFLFAAPEHSTEFLERELNAAHRAGLDGVEMVARAPINLFDTGPALRFPKQGQFNPLKYLRGLIEAITRNGGRLFSHTHVDDVHDGTPCCVHTKTGWKVRADAVVVATNVPVNDRVTIHTKQAAYRTYVIAAPVPLNKLPRALLWDTGDPYHYVRLQHVHGQEMLIVGGEDHKTGQAEHPEKRWQALAEWTRERFPMISNIVYRWSGQVIEPIDYVAFIGRNPGDKHIYIVTGDSGQGMTHGTIAAMLISDLISGRENAWEEIYDPSRKTLRAAGEFARENLNVAAQYRDYATGGDIKSADDLMLGCGAVIRHGLHKVAAYKSEDGSIHECSAVCPHMACIVHWNDVEKTWDCPCHGSRFDRFGSVLNGPAITDLKPVEGRVRSVAETATKE
jgi:glycine/D-amino acid oxidase-like deaminating enzyme/nitrite reductase/ring-hydroxylating ferredoxin subunit